MTSKAPDCDLHPWFRDPVRAKAVLDACIDGNRSKGVLQIRVVHGKGKGDFRNLIHSHLSKHPDVEGFTPCDPLHGGSGATWVHLVEDPAHPAAAPVKKTQQSTLPPYARWLLYAVAFACLNFLMPVYLAFALAVAIAIIGETKFDRKT